MNTKKMEIMHKDDLPQGGFAGLKEKRLVVDQRMWSGAGPVWNGLGNFVYLADANFIPKGQTNMHPHREVDVISVMVEGRIAHEGSLESGKNLNTNQAQVQRAGGEGFEHNEVNPDEEPNRMIQIWVLPDTPGEPAGYKSFDLSLGKITKIHGGATDQSETFSSRTHVEVGRLESNQKITRSGRFIAYITRGRGKIDGTDVRDGHVARGDDLMFEALESDTQIIIVTAD
jgi:redox-sensitive bicupin YhaK (pirin superfamily)